MTWKIPIRFESFAGHRLPTVELEIRLAGSDAKAIFPALVDTGSSVSLMPRGLLKQEGFPVAESKSEGRAVVGIGGAARTWVLERAVFVLRDADGALAPFNQERLFLAAGRFPPILGRGFLRQTNARLSVDFVDEEGFLEIG